jgi:hypothetical protein
VAQCGEGRRGIWGIPLKSEKAQSWHAAEKSSSPSSCLFLGLCSLSRKLPNHYGESDWPLKKFHRDLRRGWESLLSVILNKAQNQYVCTALRNSNHLFSALVFLFCFVFLQYWGLNSGPSSSATPPALFCVGYFWDRVSGWLWTVVLLISASWVARITCVSHQRPASALFLSMYQGAKNHNTSEENLQLRAENSPSKHQGTVMPAMWGTEENL